MADSKITALTALTAADPVNDMFPVVDVSDTTMAASGTTKKISVNNILSSSPTASGALTVTGLVTAGSATITGDLTVDTNVFKVDTTNNVVGIGTATPQQNLHVVGTGTTTMAVERSGATIAGRFEFASGNSTNVVRCVTAKDLVFEQGLGTEVHRIAANGVATWQNVGGVAATAMTLNANGLGIGVTPSAWGSNYKAVEVSGAVNVFGATSDGNLAGIGANLYHNNTNYLYRYATFATMYLQDNGTHQWHIAPSGTAGNAITFTQAMTLDASGALLVGVTSANASGGCLQLKSGITFPATQVASSDANTLDDYEEGTWTGTIGGTTGNPTTPLTATGRYTKIGRQVHVEIGFYGDTTGASGRITVSGLPFTSNASIARPGAILMDTMGTFTGSPVAFLGSGVTSLDLYASNSNGAISSVTHNTGAGRALYMELTYTV